MWPRHEYSEYVSFKTFLLYFKPISKERLIIHVMFLMVDLSLAVNRWDSFGA